MSKNTLLKLSILTLIVAQSAHAQAFDSSFSSEGELEVQVLVDEGVAIGSLNIKCDSVTSSVKLNDLDPETAVACEDVKKITVAGSDVEDQIDLSAVVKSVFPNLKSTVIKGNLGNDTIRGSAFRDDVDSGTGNDTVYAGEGNDSVEGASGDDKLYGEAGNDKLIGDSGNDKLYGGAGNDNLSGDSGNDFLDGGSGKDKGSVGSGKDKTKNLENGRGNGKLPSKNKLPKLPKLPPGFSF